jgi:hypothetical protein
MDSQPVACRVAQAAGGRLPVHTSQHGAELCSVVRRAHSSCFSIKEFFLRQELFSRFVNLAEKGGNVYKKMAEQDWFVV